MNTAWTITLAAGVLLAVAVAAFLTIRARRRAPIVEDPAPAGPTPDGPGFEDGDPMPHPRSAPFEGAAQQRRVPRAYGPGSSTGRRLTQSQQQRSGHVPDPDLFPPHLYASGPYGSGVSASPVADDRPTDTSSPSWGGYSGGGYSSGHSSGHSSSHDSGSSGGYSGGSDSGSSGGGYSGGGE